MLGVLVKFSQMFKFFGQPLKIRDIERAHTDNDVAGAHTGPCELSSPGPSAMCMNLLDMTIRLTMVACALLAASRDVHVPSSPPSPRLRRVLAVALRAEAGAALTHFPVSASQPAMTFPEATISNGQITAKIYLPDPERGFYRSTRFDWSGMIAGLEYQGHQYYGPWFTGLRARARLRLSRARHRCQGPERRHRTSKEFK